MARGKPGDNSGTGYQLVSKIFEPPHARSKFTGRSGSFLVTWRLHNFSNKLLTRFRNYDPGYETSALFSFSGTATSLQRDITQLHIFPS